MSLGDDAVVFYIGEVQTVFGTVLPMLKILSAALSGKVSNLHK